MAKWALTTRRLWARLGLKETEEPEVNYHIQPVYSVGDGSALVPPALPAMGWAGSIHNEGAVNHYAGEIQSIAPGGIFIKELALSSITATSMRFGIRDAPAGLANVCDSTDMGPLPVQSLVRYGGVVAPGIFAGDSPHRRCNAGVTTYWDDVIYVPPGKFWFFETNAPSNNNVLFSVIWTEVPETVVGSPT